MILNAVVYNSKEDEMYVAECYEIDQIGVGKNREDARKDLVKALKQIIEEKEKDDNLSLISRGTTSDKCIRSLEKAILTNQESYTRFLIRKGLIINFYNENGSQ